MGKMRRDAALTAVPGFYKTNWGRSEICPTVGKLPGYKTQRMDYAAAARAISFVWAGPRRAWNFIRRFMLRWKFFVIRCS